MIVGCSHSPLSLNHVRIHIGYWAFETGPGEPYISGQVPYLQKAITWERNHNLKVVVELHGARERLRQLREPSPYPGNKDVATVIAALNERVRAISRSPMPPYVGPRPAGFYSKDVVDVASQYWLRDSYDIIRYPEGSSEQTDTPGLFHDAFQPLEHVLVTFAP
ncbi:hypothetical protein BD413DRAFT_123277 [Trametes elegans]|nr:hypothetical protein BD413DRAFT_123277 [Trametes elegans]